MGGKNGGGVSLGDLAKLTNLAQQKLREADTENNPHVFISFAYEDLTEVNMLRGQVKNETTDLAFDDFSVKEPFNSENADYIKRKIREKIEHASVIIVYLSNDSAQSEWVNWEIEESISKGKGVIGVYGGTVTAHQLPSLFIKNKFEIVKWKPSNKSWMNQRARKKREET
jgi:hypothetical protein